MFVQLIISRLFIKWTVWNSVCCLIEFGRRKHMCADCLKTGGFRACTYHMAERAVRLTQILLRIYDNQYLSSMTRARLLGNFFSQYIGVIQVIHISTLLLSLYPQFVEMLWITLFFARFLSTISLFCLLFHGFQTDFTKWNKC